MDRSVTFRCKRCGHAFRKRVDNVVRSGRAICRDCSSSPDPVAERRVVQSSEAAMAKLLNEGVVRTYRVIRNRKVSAAELASVHKTSKRALRWDITVEAKVGAPDHQGGIQTQLVHIELDGWQHFRFSALWHKGSESIYHRSMECDKIKNSVVRASTMSHYGNRFKRVSLIRVALVRPKKTAIDEAIAAIESFLRHEFVGTEEDVGNAQGIEICNVKFHPAIMYE